MRRCCAVPEIGPSHVIFNNDTNKFGGWKHIVDNQEAFTGLTFESDAYRIDDSNFRKWSNSWLSVWYRPYHMVQDQIVPTGFSTTIVGKFDYGRLMHKDLEGECIHAYLYGASMKDWDYLGKYTTNNDGKVYVPISPRAEGDYIVRMVAEGDLSSTTGKGSEPNGTKLSITH